MATRRERVLLELEDRFSGPMARPVASTRALREELHGLDQTSVRAGRSVSKVGDRDMVALSRGADNAGRSIDKLSGRLGLALKAVGALGPGFVPIGAAAAPVLIGLSAQLGAAALGAGVLVTAFHGVGDALKAVRTAELEPTAENLVKAEEAMAGLSEEAQQGVLAMRDFAPILKRIRDASAGGFFPEFIEGLDHLEDLAPNVERIFSSVAESAGTLFSDGAESLASHEWATFFRFLENEAAPTLETFGQTLGNFGKGIAEVIMAMDPLTDDFTGGLLEMSEAFESWGEGLSRSEGFAEFVEYVRANGPQVLDTFGSLADMILQVAEAASPLGGPVLQTVEAFADAVATIADSPLGTPIMTMVAAVSALNLALKATAGLMTAAGLGGAAGVAGSKAGVFGAMSSGAKGFAADLGLATTAVAMNSKELDRNKAAAERVKGTLGTVGKAAGAMGGLALASSDVAQGLGVSNAIMGASMGLMVGGWGAAVGGGVGLMLDLASASSQAAEEQQNFQDALASGDLEAMRQSIEAKRKELADFEDSWKSDVAGALDFMGGTTRDVAMREEIARREAEYRKASAESAEEQARALGYVSAAEMDVAMSTQAANAELREQQSLLLESMSAETSYEGALNRLHETVKDGSGAFKRNGDLVRGATAEQLAAADAVIGMGAAWAELTPAERRARGGLKAAQAEVIKAAIALGMGREAAQALARELLNIPANTRADVKVTGTEQAKAAVQSVREMIDGLRGKTVNLVVARSIVGPVAGYTGVGGVTSADGNLFPARHPVVAFAGGGMDHANAHMPEIANGRTLRVWGEPETQGETYIPHANDHRRPAAKHYLERTAEMFGGSVQWFAKGGTTGGVRRSLDDQLAIQQLLAEIGGLRRSLNAKGDDALGKRQRKIAELQLRIAQRDLTAQRREVFIERQEKAVDREREHLDRARSALADLRQERRDYASTVAGNFRSDAFNQKDVFGQGGLGATFSTLRGDIRGARGFERHLNKARSLGLSGQAYRELAASGDIATVRDLDTRREVRQLEQLLAQRNRVTARLAETSADRVFSAALDRQTAMVENLERTVGQLRREFRQNGERVENGAARGTKAGMQAHARAVSRAGRK